MIANLKIFTRVLVFTGTLFLFIDCTGRIKSWKVLDKHSLDVKIFETSKWIEDRRMEYPFVDDLIREQLKFFIDTDMRNYDRLDPAYELYKESLNKIDTILYEFDKITNSLPLNSSELILNKSNKKEKKTSIKNEIAIKSKQIGKSKKNFYLSIHRMNKILKKEKKKLVFIFDETKDHKITLFNLRYERSQLDNKLQKFNKSANLAFFQTPNSFYSKEIRKISKKIAIYIKSLNEFEDFLTNIKNIALKEVGAPVYMEIREQREKNYKTKYKTDYKKYIKTINEIERLLDSI